ncbi:MAG: hypothetical protein JWM05_3632, partial [Acidimicrobiales bacterium]|nr:hypothetical protein [Acidimicrobiales bacterium]
MKVLQLCRPTDGTSRLDLHPQVTVVRGLGDQRSWFIDALAGLPRGQAVDVGGIVEAHGITFDLGPETLELLDLHAELDVVVAAENLPGHDPTVGQAAAARRAAEAARDDLLGRLQRA